MKGTHKHMKLNWNILTITDVFLDQKTVNSCEHKVKTAPYDRFGREVYTQPWLSNPQVFSNINNLLM